MLVSLLVAPALTSCQLLGGGSSLADALDIVPAGARLVTFVDRAAMAERLGVDDVATGADEQEIREYVDATKDDAVRGTFLLGDLEFMQDAAFSELDVEWSVEADPPGNGPMFAYKVDDSVDLDLLVSELEEAGMASKESGGRTVLTLTRADDGGPIGVYPPDFASGVLVAPDEDLVVFGGTDLEAVADVLDDEEDSLADAGTFDRIVADVDDVERAVIERDLTCGGYSEEQLALGVADLGAFVATGLFTSTDDEGTAVSARLQLDSEGAAEADREARADYLANGQSISSAEPVAELGSAELDLDGDVVEMALALEPSVDAEYLLFSKDAFFACNA